MERNNNTQPTGNMYVVMVSFVMLHFISSVIGSGEADTMLKLQWYWSTTVHLCQLSPVQMSFYIS